jgi:hypothetical protein
MAINLNCVIVLAVVILLTNPFLASGLVVQFRVIINPTEYICFHQYFPTNMSLHNDVVVVSGEFQTISYQIFHKDREIVNEQTRRSLWAKFDTGYEGEGEYTFCMDNRHTLVEAKHVYFYLTSNDDYQDPIFANHTPISVMPSKEELGQEMEQRTKDFKRGLRVIKKSLMDVGRRQAKHREITRVGAEGADKLNWTVTKWSMIGTCIMILVSVIQVVVIRSLFEDNSRIGRTLRGHRDYSSQKQRFGT